MYRTRRVGATILAVLTALLLLLTTLGWWAHRYLLDSQRFTDSANQIVDDQTVQDALTVAITDQISQAAGTDLDIVQPFIGSIVEGVVQSSQFQTVFDAAVYRAHDAIVSGDAQNAVLDLTTVVDRVRASIEPIAPNIAKEIPDGEQLRLQILDKTQLQTTYDTLNLVQDLVILLTVLTVVCFAGAIALSPRRWRTLALAGWVTVGLFAARLLAQRVGRGFVSSITDVPEYSKAAGSSYQIVLHGLVVQTIVVLVIALLVALFAGWTDRHGGWPAVVAAVGRGGTWAKAQLPKKAPVAVAAGAPGPAAGSVAGSVAAAGSDGGSEDGTTPDAEAEISPRAVVEGVLAPRLPAPKTAIRAVHWWRAAGLLTLGLFAVFSPGSLTTVVVVLLGIAALYLAVTEAVAAWGSPAPEKPEADDPATPDPDPEPVAETAADREA